MKLQKKIDRAKGIDTYTLTIQHAEANAAFALMTPLEKGMIAQMQNASDIPTLLKLLTIWATRIKEARGAVNRPPYQEEELASCAG